MDDLFPIIDNFFKNNSLNKLGLEESCLQILEIYLKHLRDLKISIPPDKIGSFKSESIADIKHYIRVKNYGKGP